MKLKLTLMCVACMALVLAACGDDNPVQPKKTASATFNTSQMPILVPNTTFGSGNLALDGSNSLIFATQNGILYRISRTTGELSIAAANIGINEGGPYRLMSCVYDPVADRIYVGESSSNPTRIYSVNPATGAYQLLASLGDNGYPQQLLMAPAGFGAHAGYLLVFTYSGGGNGIVAVNPGNPVSTQTVSSLKCTDAVFSPNGTLYAADWNNNRVVTVSPTGVVTDFVTGIAYPEGLEVNPAGSRLYVASVTTPDSIKSVTLPGGIVSTLPFEPELDSGYYPAGLVCYAGKLFFCTGESSLSIDFYDL